MKSFDEWFYDRGIVCDDCLTQKDMSDIYAHDVDLIDDEWVQSAICKECQEYDEKSDPSEKRNHPCE